MAVRAMISRTISSLKFGFQSPISTLLTSQVKPEIITITSSFYGNRNLSLASSSSFSTITPSKISCFSPLNRLMNKNWQNTVENTHSDLLRPFQVINVFTRTVTKSSMNKGKRKSVKAVRLRFFRLQPGVWIRTWAGRHKHLWKKNNEMKRRYRTHIFVTKAQSKMFEKMVQGYWKKPKYYIDDPYEPYHIVSKFVPKQNPK